MTAAQTQAPETTNAEPMPQPPLVVSGSKLDQKNAMLDYYWRLAQFAVKGGLAPKGMNAEACVIAMVFGEAFNMEPIQALWDIAVINGRPSMWGDMMLGICMSSGKFEFEGFDEHLTGEFGKDDWTASCTVQRVGVTRTRTDTFTVAQAKRAGLWDKNVWKTYPHRMIQMRARGFALRNTFPDVLKGLYTTEELLAGKALDALDLESAVQVATGRELAVPPRSAREIAAEVETAPNPPPPPRNETMTKGAAPPEPLSEPEAAPKQPCAEPPDTRTKKKQASDKVAIIRRVTEKWAALAAEQQRTVTAVPPAGIGVIAAWTEQEILDLEIEIGDAAGGSA
jgi:hypothetical protein